MKRWFSRLPIHRKLVVMALVVTTVGLAFATIGLETIDVLRYRDNAAADTAALAAVIADNAIGAVRFEDHERADSSLATAKIQATVQRACLYLPDGTLFSEFARTPDSRCPASPPKAVRWSVVAGSAEVRSNDKVIGLVYVERDLTEIGSRIALAAFTGVLMALAAALLAFLLAERLHRTVSAPISQLAAVARALRPESRDIPKLNIRAGEDEVGDLVKAFDDMLRRVHDTNSRLLESNEALRVQQAERETLLRRERDASRLKDEFLAAVSHELRTPLNTILGWVQILSTTQVGKETTDKALAAISRNAKAQARVIEDLVDVSRIVTGKLNLRFEPIDLRTVAETSLEIVKPAAAAKGITLKGVLPPDPCFVNGDVDRLQQIVGNVLSNAIKFTPEGGAVTLTLLCQDSGFDFEIKDTGIGIPASFLPHVFDRFRQADGSMTREHGGLGLGLAIVKELTELHFGTVTAESDGAGKGAAFTIKLPRMLGLDVPASARPPVIDGDATLLRGIRILAVDDNKDALDMLAASLISHGADVRTTDSGEHALATWAAQPADVLICDLAMPHLNGFDVLRGIRSQASAQGTPVRAIALTAHASDDDQARTRAAGFDFHVSKPYDVMELGRIVLRAAGRD